MNVRLKILMSVGLIFLATVIAVPSLAQQDGLGYSEGPFELVEGYEEVTGPSPFELLQAVAAEEDIPMVEYTSFEATEGDTRYVFINITANYIDNTAVVKSPVGEDEWSLVCREASRIPVVRLAEDCGLGQALATTLNEGFDEALEAWVEGQEQ